jgi:hypothetical protein
MRRNTEVVTGHKTINEFSFEWAAGGQTFTLKIHIEAGEGLKVVESMIAQLK